MFSSFKTILVASLIGILFISCSDENCMYENPTGNSSPVLESVGSGSEGGDDGEIKIDDTAQALLTAIHKNDKDSLVKLLGTDKGKEYVNKPIVSEDMHTLLMIAAEWGRQDLVLSLIKAGADKDIESPEGFKAAYYARKSGYLRIAKFLESTLSIEEINKQLYISAAEKVEDIEFYANLGADLDYVAPGAGNVLMRAITSNRLENVKKLIELGADPSLTVTVRGRELDALGYAKAARTNPDIIAYLEGQI